MQTNTMFVRLKKGQRLTERCPSVIDEILTLLMSVSEAEQLNMIDELLSATLKMLHINIDLPKDFVSKAVAGMQYLKKCQRYNIIYGIAKGLYFRASGCEYDIISGGSRGGSLGSNEPPFFLNSAFQTLTDPAFELSAK